jgi:rhodanese-related sulfurtransferase
MHPHEVPTVHLEDLPVNAILLDVREDDEWAAGHIAGAVHIPMNQVPQHATSRPEVFAAQAPLVVVCAMGSRSAQVTAWLVHNGIEAENLEGGMTAWAAAGRPVVAGS